MLHTLCTYTNMTFYAVCDLLEKIALGKLELAFMWQTYL